MKPDPRHARDGFDRLSYDVVIAIVEDMLRTRCTNLCRPLNSYINRVYEVHPSEGEPVIVKFFRPGRWSREALLEEQVFLFELRETDVPVVVPFGDNPEDALGDWEGVAYAVYPKKGGRICDEPTASQWGQLGRLIGRVHQVGAAAAAEHRPWLHPESVTADHVEFIVDSGAVSPEHEAAYEDVAFDLVERVAPLFDEPPFLRLHGDVHRQNLIHRPDEPFTIIDFDDMVMGPAVQDVWMLLPGRPHDCAAELDWLLDGYETFRPFDRTQLGLIEPLRAMRYIHYTAWCAHQAADGGLARLEPDWGSPAYWRRQVGELREQLARIEQRAIE